MPPLAPAGWPLDLRVYISQAVHWISSVSWYLNGYLDVENILAYIGWTWAMLTLAWVSGHGLNMLASFITRSDVHQPIFYTVSCPSPIHLSFMNSTECIAT